jgi:group I intron endonuclease
MDKNPPEIHYIYTINFKNRMARHRSSKEHYYICRSIQKYGWENFSSQILATCIGQKEADRLEAEFIVTENSLAINGCGYNIRTGGDVSPLPDEVKQKISAKGRGVKKSAEHVAKVAAAHRGMKRSEQAKLNMSKPKTWSSPAKERFSAKRTGFSRIFSNQQVEDIQNDNRSITAIAFDYKCKYDTIRKIKIGKITRGNDERA